MVSRTLDTYISPGISIPIYRIYIANSVYSCGPLGSRILEYIDTYILFTYINTYILFTYIDTYILFIYTHSIPRIYLA